MLVKVGQDFMEVRFLFCLALVWFLRPSSGRPGLLMPKEGSCRVTRPALIRRSKMGCACACPKSTTCRYAFPSVSSRSPSNPDRRGALRTVLRRLRLFGCHWRCVGRRGCDAFGSQFNFLAPLVLVLGLGLGGTRLTLSNAIHPQTGSV